MGIELETTSGRTMKFTPERLEQIKNLVERGMPREEIAETIGSNSRITSSYMLEIRYQSKAS